MTQTQKPTLWTKIKGAIFFCGMILSATIHSTLTLFTFWVPFPQRYRFINLWCRFMLWWTRVMCNLDYTIEGSENIPKNQPYILLSNHESTWETFSLLDLFAPAIPALKKELTKLPFFGWGVRLLRPIVIDRANPEIALQTLVTQGLDRLQSGCNVLLFPQGTRVAPGEEGKYTLGGAALAAATGYPILPIVHNSGDFWARRSFLKKPGTIKVVVGPLIETKGLNIRQIHKLSKQWMVETRKKI